MQDPPVREVFGAHIVVAEDDPRLRHSLALGLGKDGHRVEEASSGLELLARLDAWGVGPGVDLVISSVRLPGLTGLDLLAGLRSAQRPEQWETPVILITDVEDDETYERAAILNASVFARPFDVGELCELVHRVLVGTGGVV